VFPERKANQDNNVIIGTNSFKLRLCSSIW